MRYHQRGEELIAAERLPGGAEKRRTANAKRDVARNRKVNGDDGQGISRPEIAGLFGKDRTSAYRSVAACKA